MTQSSHCLKSPTIQKQLIHFSLYFEYRDVITHSTNVLFSHVLYLIQNETIWTCKYGNTSSEDGSTTHCRNVIHGQILHFMSFLRLCVSAVPTAHFLILSADHYSRSLSKPAFVSWSSHCAYGLPWDSLNKSFLLILLWFILCSYIVLARPFRQSLPFLHLTRQLTAEKETFSRIIVLNAHVSWASHRTIKAKPKSLVGI